MSGFFIDTESGRVATRSQLIGACLAGESDPPAPPWHPVQGTSDASTVIYGVMRKRVAGRRRDAWIGTLCIRHGEYKASLEEPGWEEVPVEQIGDRGET
jgi:hypothetical protein